MASVVSGPADYTHRYLQSVSFSFVCLCVCVISVVSGEELDEHTQETKRVANRNK